MNIFQKQLVIGGKSLAELPDPDGNSYERKIITPAKVSVEEFLQTQKEIIMTDEPITQAEILNNAEEADEVIDKEIQETYQNEQKNEE